MAQGWIAKVHVVVFVYIVVLVSNISGVNRDYYDAQKRLIKKLISDSDIMREILPVQDSSTPIILRVNLGIRQIATVDEVNQAMRLNVWLRLYWNNPFLTWNPEDYNNVTSINLDNSLVWTPDIAMYNKASLEEEIDILYKRLSTPVVLQHDGNCSWKSPATLLSQCRINVLKFPFDEQECPLTFGSWTYTAQSMIVVAAGADLDDFIPNGEWVVLGNTTQNNNNRYDGVNYTDVTLKFHIKRQPLYYTLNLILPCTVIAVLAFMAFVLPSNHGERVSLVITVLLAMSVYMLIVSSTLPQTSDAMPVIGTYFLCIIVEIALSLLATCLVAKIHDRSTEMPKWLDKLVNKRLARLLLVPTVKENDGKMLSKYEHTNGHAKTTNDTNLNEVIYTDDIMKKVELANQKAVQSLCDEMSVLADDVRKRQKRDAKKKKWQHAARVLDRFFLYSFSLLFVIITAAVFA